MAKISPATMTAAIFAILLGLAGAYSVRLYLSGQEVIAEQEAPPAPQMVYVPVAAREMEVGQKVTINDIVVQKYTQEEFAGSPFANRLFMTDTTQISGKQLQKKVAKGTEFAPDSFFPDGMGPGVTRLLKPGHRAVTIPIQTEGAVEGFASPGTMVDVYFRSQPVGNRPEVVLTLLEQVEVLAVDRDVLPGQLPGSATGRPTTVTLGVSPQQARALKAVEGRGELSLALRHPDDTGTLASTDSLSQDRVSVDQIVGTTPTFRKATMEIYSGGARREVSFQESVPRSPDELIQTPIRPDAGEVIITRAGTTEKSRKKKKRESKAGITLAQTEEATVGRTRREEGAK